MPSDYSLEDKMAYADWLAASDAVRRRFSMPASKEAYGKQRRIPSRTLRRWEQTDEFKALLAEAKARAESGDGPEPTAPVDESGRAQSEYERVKASILEAALAGDTKAQDQYMRHFGVHFAQEERAARSRGLQDKSDDELVAETLAIIGRERVRAWLTVSV